MKITYPGEDIALIDEPVGRDSYAQRILIQNEIAGLIRLRIKSTDGERRYCYDIRGKRALAERDPEEPLTGEEIRELFKALAETDEELAGYLLESDQLILEPELLFRDEAGRILFCACPGYGVKLQKGINRLCEWVLEHVDRTDEAAAEAALRIYRMSESADVSADEIAECLELMSQRAPENPAPKRWRRYSVSRSSNKTLCDEEQRENRRKAKKHKMRRALAAVMPVLGAATLFFLIKSGILESFSLPIRVGICLMAAAFYVMMTLILLDTGREVKLDPAEAVDMIGTLDDKDELPEIVPEDEKEQVLYVPDAPALRGGDTVSLTDIAMRAEGLGSGHQR